MITLTSDAPDEFFAVDRYGDTIFIKATNGTFEYHYSREEQKLIDVHPDPGKHMYVPANDGYPFFVYKRGRKL